VPCSRVFHCNGIPAAVKPLLLNGGRDASFIPPASGVSKRTHTVIAGASPGTKLARAQELGVRVIAEAAFAQELAGAGG